MNKKMVIVATLVCAPIFINGMDHLNTLWQKTTQAVSNNIPTIPSMPTINVSEFSQNVRTNIRSNIPTINTPKIPGVLQFNPENPRATKYKESLIQEDKTLGRQDEEKDQEMLTTQANRKLQSFNEKYDNKNYVYACRLQGLALMTVIGSMVGSYYEVIPSKKEAQSAFMVLFTSLMGGSFWFKQLSNNHVEEVINQIEENNAV